MCYTSDLGALLKEQARGRDLHVTNAAARERLEAALSGSSAHHGSREASGEGRLSCLPPLWVCSTSHEGASSLQLCIVTWTAAARKCITEHWWWLLLGWEQPKWREVIPDQ